MAIITEILKPTVPRSKLRQFDPRRDLLPVADLIELCFADSLDPDGRRYLERMRSMAARPHMLFLAHAGAEPAGSPFFGYVWQEDQQVVGNVSLIPYQRSGKRVYLIANVAVHPDFRRRGIARQLTLKAIEFARQRKAPAVWLHVREENSGAYALYRQLGFSERARRSTWIGSTESELPPVVPEVKFTRATSRHWPAQRAALLRSYPPEVSWHLSFDADVLNPGLWGAFSRLWKQAFVQQWSAVRGGEWLGTLSWQFSATYANALWLALPEQASEQVIRGLLQHAQQNTTSSRPVSLDYPAGLFSDPIRSAGFRCHQTLIWMELAML